jgi:hypothetical protein
MAITNVKTNNGAITRRGFDSAVDSFCDKANGQTLGKGLYLSLATRVFLDDGGDPASHGINGFVYFEVHNKGGSDHHIDGKFLDIFLSVGRPNLISEQVPNAKSI